MAILVVIVNCILYLAFGSFVAIRKDRQWSIALTLVVGFFAYYGLFSIVCLPIMLTYRPLSLLVRVWSIVAVFIFVLAIVLYRKSWASTVKSRIIEVKENKALWITIVIITLAQVLLVANTYYFTLDAAYYVANVSTSVETNMINVYDPFTGAWQDHFELRYAFATYSIHDAVTCVISGLSALVVTKTVMASIVMILVNVLYVYITGFLCKDDNKQRLIMYLACVFVNLTFITLYTPSNFLMMRAYEGKAIVGNVAIILIFALYMNAVRSGTDFRYFLMMFVTCFGVATISSTANMVIPAEIAVLFVPYILKNRDFKMIPKILVCILPEVLMMLMYVLYVKGYFAIYTYPR